MKRLDLVNKMGLTTTFTKSCLGYTLLHFHVYKVKDESIVRLTNQIHEMELKTVVTLSTSVPPSPRLNTPGNFTEKIS